MHRGLPVGRDRAVPSAADTATLSRSAGTAYRRGNTAPAPARSFDGAVTSAGVHMLRVVLTGFSQPGDESPSKEQTLFGSRRRADASRRSSWTPSPSSRGRRRRRRRRAHLGRDRRPALRPRLPARLPPDRQPARRRGPHPGGLRPRLPQPLDLHARHLRGLAAPDHHQPLPRPGPPQAADPLRRALRRAGRPAPSDLPDARHGVRRPAPSTTTSSARWPRLPPEFRAAVVLCDVEGLSYEEIAADPRRQARHRPLPHPPRPRHAARGARPPRPGDGPHPLLGGPAAAAVTGLDAGSAP